MAVTILDYLWILTHVHLHDNIRPSSSGLRYLYNTSTTSYGILHPPTIRSISENRKYNALSRILRVMTGIPIQEDISLDASAVSESGMSICCVSLLNPGLPPRGRAPFHLIPGHIQKDSALFAEVYDLDTKFGIRLEEDTVMKLTFDDKLRLMMSFRQNKPLPELLIKETIHDRKLQANYSWQYQLFNDQLRENPPVSGDIPASSTKMLVTAFGSAELQRLLFTGIVVANCECRKMEATTADNSTVSGTCCKATEDVLLQVASHPSRLLPRPGEWVLLDIGIQREAGGYDGEEYPTKLYRGSLVELYTLLCNSEPERQLKLVCASNCLFCTCLWKARTIHIFTGQKPSPDTISIDGIRVLETEDEKSKSHNAEKNIDQIDEHVAGVGAVDDSLPSPPSSRRGAKPEKRKGAPGTRKNPKRRATAK